METSEEFQERWRREQRLRQRLQLAAFRLEAAQIERAWAVRSAHQQGLSIREIAAAIGLSRARVHQLLSEAATAEVPAQVNSLREQGWPATADDTGASAASSAATRAPIRVAARRSCIAGYGLGCSLSAGAGSR
jgi:hypothetical protein